VTGSRRRARLGVLAGAVVAAAGVAPVVGLAGWLGATGRLDGAVAGALAAASAGALAAAAGAGWLADRVGRRLRAVGRNAVRRIADPAAALPTERGWTRPPGAEVAELAATVDGLAQRVRVADELAERYRRSAETASAGMFELLSGLVAAEEGARGQLSAELHDTLAQSLLLARSLLTGCPPDPDRAAELVAEAEEQVRALLSRLRPAALREGDLAGAVGQLAEEYLARYGLVIDLSWPARAHPLPMATAVTVYRFFQEALSNVVKHADGDRARAGLTVDGTEVVATVADDGPGFDPDQVRPRAGRQVGLVLLAERARLAGGALTVRSAPDAGTAVTLRLPRGAGQPTLMVPVVAAVVPVSDSIEPAAFAADSVQV
jgi:signal transduction histidine kinase